MTAYYVLVFGILSCFFGSVIYALHWSIRHGQFSDYQRGAASIFDEDEPIGRLTDCFPDTEFPETESPETGSPDLAPPKGSVSSVERLPSEERE